MPDDTAKKILSVARQLFESQGFSATSMREIAENAGIGKATIYHHFKDKNALFLALLEMAGQNFRIDPAGFANEPDPRQRIRNVTVACLSYLADRMDLMTIARREVPEARARLQSEYNTIFHELALALSQAIQQGMDDHTFRSVDSQQAAQNLFAMIQGTYAMSYLAGARIASPEKSALGILDIFFQGLDRR
jgi:AcrR family transcriptional regulator